MNPALFVLAVLFGVAGYQEARRFGRQHGRTPWGWDPWVWGIVMFLSFLIGVILLAIAERQGRKSSSGAPAQYVAAGQPAYGAAPGLYPTYPPTPQATPSAPVAATNGFWAKDPSGRFEFRWWDGQQWTDAVSRGGVISTDQPTG